MKSVRNSFHAYRTRCRPCWYLLRLPKFAKTSKTLWVWTNIIGSKRRPSRPDRRAARSSFRWQPTSSTDLQLWLIRQLYGRTGYEEVRSNLSDNAFDYDPGIRSRVFSPGQRRLETD